MSETPTRFALEAADDLLLYSGRATLATIDKHLAAAEERGRRRGVEEAAKEVESITHEGAVSELIAYAAKRVRALAPRDPHASEGPPCAGCGHPKWQHQYGSKEHAFCSQQVDGLQLAYCSCKNYLAPRDSGKERP